MIEKIVFVWIVVTLTLWFVAQFIERWQAARREQEAEIISRVLREMDEREVAMPVGDAMAQQLVGKWIASETDAMYRAYVREHEAQELQDALRLPELDDIEFMGLN